MFSWNPSPFAAAINLSVPVAFQYPDAAALFGRAPLGYFLSLGLKKYHSFSPNGALAETNHRTCYNTNQNVKKMKIYIDKRKNILINYITW